MFFGTYSSISIVNFGQVNAGCERTLFDNLTVIEHGYYYISTLVIIMAKMYFTLFLQRQPSRGVLIKGCCENTEQNLQENTCRSVISTNLFCNFIEITFRDECSLVNLPHIFRTSFAKNNLWSLEGCFSFCHIAKSHLFYCLKCRNF